MDKNIVYALSYEYAKDYPNDPKMHKFCMSRVSDAVLLESGLIFIFEKPLNFLPPLTVNGIIIISGGSYESPKILKRREKIWKLSSVFVQGYQKSYLYCSFES